jgi:hypothetical protein
VWNLPFSPHRSTFGGRSAGSGSSYSRPAKERSSRRGSTQTTIARNPSARNRLRELACVAAPDWKLAAFADGCQPTFPIRVDVLEKEVVEHDLLDVSQIAASAIASLEALVGESPTP